MITMHINRKKPGKYYTVTKSQKNAPVVTQRHSQREKFLIYFPAEREKTHLCCFSFCNALHSSSNTILRACNLIVHQNLSRTMHYTTQDETFGCFYADRLE